MSLGVQKKDKGKGIHARENGTHGDECRDETARSSISSGIASKIIPNLPI